MKRCNVRLTIPQVPDAGSMPPCRTISIIGTAEGQMLARFEIETILGYTPGNLAAVYSQPQHQHQQPAAMPMSMPMYGGWPQQQQQQQQMQPQMQYAQLAAPQYDMYSQYNQAYAGYPQTQSAAITQAGKSYFQNQKLNVYAFFLSSIIFDRSCFGRVNRPNCLL